MAHPQGVFFIIRKEKGSIFVKKIKMLAPIITNNINEIKTLCEEHQVKELYVFGSAATDKFNDESDVDLLVEFNDMDILGYADNYFDLMEKLTTVFKRETDLVTVKSIKNPVFKRIVNRTKVPLFLL